VCTLQSGYVETNSKSLSLRRSWSRDNRFVALKILRADSTSVKNQPKEADVLQHIAQANPQHPGHSHIVQILDSFVHKGPNGEHSCIVFEALGQSVLSFQKSSERGQLPLDVVRTIARQLLLALDYIHSCCNLIHTGNTLIGFVC